MAKVDANKETYQRLTTTSDVTYDSEKKRERLCNTIIGIAGILFFVGVIVGVTLLACQATGVVNLGLENKFAAFCALSIGVFGGVLGGGLAIGGCTLISEAQEEKRHEKWTAVHTQHRVRQQEQVPL